MSVDKFGRYYSDKKSSDKGVRGPKGEGFNLTPDGNYDMLQKRLVNVGESVENQDAVNYETHVQAFRNCISLQNNVFDAQNTRICNMGSPVEENDAVTKHFMESKVPVKLKDSYSFNQYRLQDVAVPTLDGDAVNRLYLETNTMHRTNEGVYNAKDTVIRNVAAPVEDKDAVNLSFFRNNTIFKDTNGVFDVKNTTIANLAPPTKAGDAVNKVYLANVTPIPGATTWNFKNKKLSQVAAPTHVYDAVNLKFLQENTIPLCDPMKPVDPRNPTKACIGNNNIEEKTKEPYWNAGDKRIKRLKKPHGMLDAVNKRYVKDTLADLAYAIYKQLKHSSPARASFFNEEEWKREVVQESTSWDDLFNDTKTIGLSEEDTKKQGVEQP